MMTWHAGWATADEDPNWLLKAMEEEEAQKGLSGFLSKFAHKIETKAPAGPGPSTGPTGGPGINITTNTRYTGQTPQVQSFGAEPGEAAAQGAAAAGPATSTLPLTSENLTVHQRVNRSVSTVHFHDPNAGKEEHMTSPFAAAQTLDDGVQHLQPLHQPSALMQHLSRSLSARASGNLARSVASSEVGISGELAYLHW